MSCSKDSDCRGQWTPNAVCLGQMCYPNGESGNQMMTYTDALPYKYYMYCTFYVDQSFTTTKTAWLVPITSGSLQGRFQLIDITTPPSPDSLVVFLGKPGTIQITTPLLLKTSQGYFSVNKTTKQVEVSPSQQDAFSFSLNTNFSMAINLLFSPDQSLYMMLSDYDALSNTIAVTMYSDSDPGPPAPFADAQFSIRFADVIGETCRSKADCLDGQICQGQEFAPNKCVPMVAMSANDYLKKIPIWVVIVVGVLALAGLVAYIHKQNTKSANLD